MSFDLVLVGATGFTGGLTADYLAEHAPSGLRWAIAGRNQERLSAVRRRLAARNPALAELPLVTVDSADPVALAELVGRTKVVASTVGPYLHHGEPLVAACAAAGTDYLDLTGEPEFVDLMYARHHSQAVSTGARLVHCCGFDSIPPDLGVYYTVRQLPDDRPITVDGIVRANGSASGGTVASALNVLSRSRSAALAARARAQLDPAPDDRRIRTGIGAPRRIDGFWALPLPTIDAQVVARSARALPSYGPDFRYQHWAGFRRLPFALGAGAGGLGLLAAVQLPPARALLGSRVRPGTGPSAERRAQGWFRTRIVAMAGNRRLVTEVSGGDPGYGETAKMLSEAALCLALDGGLPAVSGQLTPAAAMGDRLLARLVAAGIRFETLVDSEAEPRPQG